MSVQFGALTGKGFFFSPNGIYSFLIFNTLGNDNLVIMQAIKTSFDESE